MRQLAGSPRWKSPVQVIGDLPALGNVVGDVRLVIIEKAIFEWTGVAWEGASGGPSVKDKAIVGVSAVTAFRALKRGTGGVAHCDGATVGDSGLYIGVSLQGGAPGAQVEYISSGKIADASLSFDTTKGIFVGTAGALMQPPLAGLAFVLQIASPLAADAIIVDKGQAIVA